MVNCFIFPQTHEYRRYHAHKQLQQGKVLLREGVHHVHHKNQCMQEKWCFVCFREAIQKCSLLYFFSGRNKGREWKSSVSSISAG